MVNFIAKRRVGQFELYCDGFHIGNLNDCEVTWLFEAAGDDEVVEQAINDRLEGDMSITEMFAVVRNVYEGFLQMWKDECAAEEASDKAYYNKAEYCAEAQAEMEMEDAMGKS